MDEIQHTEVDGFPVVSGRRTMDWVAWIEGHPATRDFGPTREEAIEDVLRTAKTQKALYINDTKYFEPHE